MPKVSPKCHPGVTDTGQSVTDVTEIGIVTMYFGDTTVQGRTEVTVPTVTLFGGVGDTLKSSQTLANRALRTIVSPLAPMAPIKRGNSNIRVYSGIYGYIIALFRGIR